MAVNGRWMVRETLRSATSTVTARDAQGGDWAEQTNTMMDAGVKHVECVCRSRISVGCGLGVRAMSFVMLWFAFAVM